MLRPGARPWFSYSARLFKTHRRVRQQYQTCVRAISGSRTRLVRRKRTGSAWERETVALVGANALEVMQEPETFSNAPSASLNRSENLQSRQTTVSLLNVFFRTVAPHRT